MSRSFVNPDVNHQRISYPVRDRFTGDLTAITKMCWFNRQGDTGSQGGRFFACNSASEGFGDPWAMQFQASQQIRSVIRTSAGSSTVDHNIQDITTDDVWYHLVATWDGSTHRVYKLNTSVQDRHTQSSSTGSIGGTMDAAEGPLTIGGLKGGNRQIEGYLAEIAVWNVALSIDEIFAASRRVWDVRRDAIVFYDPCNARGGTSGNEITLDGFAEVGTYEGTGIPAIAPHPPITSMFSRQTIFLPIAGVIPPAGDIPAFMASYRRRRVS